MWIFDMKTLTTLSALAFAPALFAAQFSASYVFDDGAAISATFDGTLDGVRIVNIENVVAEVTGTWWTYNDGPQMLTYARSLNGGAAELSIDGSYMNFMFGTQNEVEDGEEWAERNMCWHANTLKGSTALYHYQAGGNYAFDASRWSVSQVEEEVSVFSFARFSAQEDAPTVPDGGVSWLWAAVMVGIVCVRRASK